MPDPRSHGTKRKTSSRGNFKKPRQSAHMTERWKDPAYREKMALVFAKRDADRKANPEKYKRTRIPDGMRRPEAQALRAKAETLAENFIKMMQDEGALPIAIPETEDAMAVAALKETFTMALMPGDQKVQLAALRTVLEYTKSKPESKSKVTVEKAEDWLAAAQADMARGAD